MVTEETQGNESTGSQESTASTGSESSSTQGSTSSEVMPDDPKYAETGGDELTAAKTIDGKPALEKMAAYQPNFKFKVLDKEQEIDEWLKPVIKDAETEKKVRDLYERAFGLEHVKSDRQRLREQNQFQQNDIARHSQVVNNVNQMLANKDYDSLFSNVLKIPEDDILRQAQKILQLREMPPEQRQAIEHARQVNQRAYELENQNQQLMQTNEHVAVTARTQELDWTLQRPEFSQVAQAYDARLGQQGAFRNAMIERGKYNALALGRDITPEQAANEVLQFIGGRQNLIPAQNTQTFGNGAAQVVPERKPVITNIQGRGTSPAKKMVRSIDDLKKRAKEMASE